MRAIAFLAILAAAGDPVEEGLEKFRERMQNAPDPTARAIAVHEVAALRDPRVAADLRPLLGHRDIEVRLAAAQTIGEQGDPATAALLDGLLAKEEDAKEPNFPFLEALVEGLGEADLRGRFKRLEKVSRKWVAIRPSVAVAAARAMARGRSPEAVEELLALQEKCDGLRLAQSTDHWKRAYGDAVEACIRELKKVTGKDIQTVKAWRDWWRENGKTWKAPSPDAEKGPAADPDVWVDDAERFAIKRPSASWARIPPKDYALIVEGSAEGRVVCRVWVHVQDVSVLASQTPRAMAEEKRPGIEEFLKDVRKDRTKWSQKTSLAGESAVRHDIHARHPDFGECNMRYTYAVRDGLLYTITGMCRASKDEPLWKEFEGLLGTFRFRKK